MDMHFNPIKHTLCAVCLLLASGISQAKTYPSYLTPDYCDGLVEQFVGSGMRSLNTYVNEHFNPEFRGGIRNTIGFLEQRSAWLGECDEYLRDTASNNVFFSEEITREIFEAMDALAKELQLVRQGVEYPDEAGNNNPKPFIKERYDVLAKLVDQHYTRMLMKRQFR